MSTPHDDPRADGEAAETGVEIRPFAAADESVVLELLGTSFVDWASQIAGTALPELFRWKHSESPFGESLRLVAVVDGEVAGFIAYMPWRMHAGERTILSMRGVDLAVSPSYRRRGIGSALIRAGGGRFLAEGVSFTWSNPNDQSRSRTAAAGRARVGRFAPFTTPHVPLRIRSRLFAAAGSADSRAPHELEPARAAGELLEGAREGWDGAVGGAPQGGRLQTARELEFPRWRYGRFAEYRAASVAGGSGAPDGLVIFRMRSSGRFLVCIVGELLVRPGDWRTARQLLAQLRRAVSFDAIACSFPSWASAARCGFVPARGGASIAVGQLDRALRPDPTQRSSWLLSLGDLELV